MTMINDRFRRSLKEYHFFRYLNDFRNNLLDRIHPERHRIADEKKKSLEIRALLSHIDDDIKGIMEDLSLAKINSVLPAKKPFKGEVALVFLVDLSYLKPFITLMYTLHKTNSFNGIPKVVLTTDERIIDHPILNCLADEVIFFSQCNWAEINLMQKHPRNEYFERTYIGNVTFLKLLAFKFLGYRRHIFLDCDMLCVNNADNLSQKVSEADLAGAPTVPVSLYYKPGTRDRDMSVNYCDPQSSDLLPVEEMDRKYIHLFDELGGSAGDIPLRRMNSGVLLINEAMINDIMYRLLVELGRISCFHGDQDLIFRMTQLIEDINYRCLPIWYNVNRPAYDYLGRSIYERDKHKIIFHHYSGADKPWQEKFKYGETWVDMYWKEQYEEAKRFFDFSETLMVSPVK